MKRLCLLLFPVLLLVACGPGESAVSAVDADADDDADMNAAGAEQVRSLLIVDSIGVEIGDPDYVFGSIEAVSHTDYGNILVLDRPACSVVEYTPEGEFMNRMGRSGSGPGEFLNPLAMARLGDGRIAVFDINNGGLFTYLADGNYEGKTDVQYNEPVLFLTSSVENTFIGTINSFDFVDEELLITATVARFGLDSAEPLSVYWENSFSWDFRDLTVLVTGSYFAQTWASDRNGNVFVAPRSAEEYIINGYTAEGEPTITIELDIDPVGKTDNEIAEEAYFWNRRAENMGANGPFNYQPDEYRWMVHSMGIDGEERLWVRRGTEETPTFDVFDLDGNYLFKVELAGVGGPGGLFWEIKIDEFGILAYSLDPEDGYQKLYILALE
ncbi:MAG: hypothetical protein KAR40_06845 [Candidatus Sabulitectum sp.]|nr:hypothetical protein [Candidatus Sabulitectum sp.]